MKCSATKADGSPCGAYAMKDSDLCAGHAGVVGGDTSKYSKRIKLAPDQIDTSLPERVLTEIASDLKTPHASRVAAARALGDLTKTQTTRRDLSTAEVIRLREYFLLNAPAEMLPGGLLYVEPTPEPLS